MELKDAMKMGKVKAHTLSSNILSAYVPVF